MMLLFYLLLMVIAYLISEVIDLWNTTVGSAFFYILFFSLWFDYAFLEIAYKTIVIPLTKLV